MTPTPALTGSESQGAFALIQRARLAALLDEMPTMTDAMEKEARAEGGWRRHHEAR